jgi:replicative DNA helicase
MKRGKSYVLAALSNMGKSLVAVEMGTNAAKAGHGVLVLSMEMSKDEWFERMKSAAVSGRPGAADPLRRCA